MVRIRFNYTKAASLIKPAEVRAMAEQVKQAHRLIEDKNGQGKEFLGWVDWPAKYSRSEELGRIKAAAKKIRRESEVLVVVGIGGSYLGARAAIEVLSPNFSVPFVVYAGNNISPNYLADLLAWLKKREFSINVISKSGTTLEPAVAFRFLRALLEEKYGQKEAAGRIYATTDKQKGALKKLAEEQGYQAFIIPDDIGGRYSVLSAVGLLPMVAAGLDVDRLLAGAAEGVLEFSSADLDNNPAYLYAAVRNLLFQRGKTTEILVNYEPAWLSFAEWWKQLFGESEGKNGTGIFPASVLNSTDLHSMGQYIQEGRRDLFETVIKIDQPERNPELGLIENDPDSLNYLAGKTVDSVNKKVLAATAEAHSEGGVPNLLIQIEKADALNLGKLFYFFEKACAIGGYILGINPFDQPGVEIYKQKMMELLRKT